MIIESTFKPAWWLKNSHIQTIYPTLVHRTPAVIDYCERLELPDGDFIDLAWAINGLPASAPLVVLLHGLGGSINSVYVAGLLRAFRRAGYRGVLMHFRGASGEPNRLPRTYHSGDTGDLAYLLQCLYQREPNTKKAVVGVSLGGNVLLKWLGEMGAQSLIKTAVAISVPFELERVADRVNQGFSRLYQAYLLQGLRTVFLKKWELVNTVVALTPSDLCSLKTLMAFDDCITAPLHGFKNAKAYYAESSSRQYLSAIKTPTLIVHALDDPFMTPDVVPEEKELSSDVILELSQNGGHVGFVTEHNRNQVTSWLEQRVADFLGPFLSETKRI